MRRRATLYPMLDLTLLEDRRTLVPLLHTHATHLTRLVSTLQSDAASGTLGSILASSAVESVQQARRFVTDPSDARGQALLDQLERQYVTLDLLVSSDLAQEAIVAPHRTRLLHLISDAFPSAR